MMPPITLDAVCEIHANMIQDFPATAGLKNTFLTFQLDTLLKDNSTFQRNCFEKAANISCKLIADKPFNSLNKRMAIALISLYLDKAGFEFTASSLDALQFVNDIENGLSLQQAEEFIRNYSKKI